MSFRSQLAGAFAALFATAPAWGDPERPRLGSAHYQSAQRVECSFVIAWHAALTLEYDPPVIDEALLAAELDPLQKRHGWDDDRRTAVAMAAQALVQTLADANLTVDFRLVRDDVVFAFLRSAVTDPDAMDDLKIALALLRRIPDSAFRWNTPLLSHGPVLELQEVLVDAGVFVSDAQPALVALRTIATTEFRDETTRRIVGLLSRTADVPIVCVTGKKSRIAKNSRLAAFYQPVFASDVIVRRVPEIITPPHFPERVAETGLPRLSEFIVTTPPNASGVDDPATWASYVVHELTHWYDFRLLSAWVRANQRRINRGLPPDVFFAAYVRLSEENGVPVIALDQRFLTMFLESRAYRVEADVYDALVSHREMYVRAVEYSRIVGSGYQYVRMRGGARMLQDFGVLHPGPEFFELGKQIVAVMEATMRSVDVPIP